MSAADDMNRCINCSSTFVRPVRPAWWQWLRLRFTSLRPHECWHCGWRGWLPLEDPYARHADVTPGDGAERRLHDRRRPEHASPSEGEPTSSTPQQPLLR